MHRLRISAAFVIFNVSITILWLLYFDHTVLLYQKFYAFSCCIFWLANVKVKASFDEKQWK